MIALAGPATFFAATWYAAGCLPHTLAMLGAPSVFYEIGFFLEWISFGYQIGITQILSVCPQQMNIFCNCSCPLPDDKNELLLMRRFQRAIVCPQQTKICKDIEA